MSHDWTECGFDKRHVQWFRVEGSQFLTEAQYVLGERNIAYSRAELAALTPIRIQSPATGVWDNPSEGIAASIDTQNLQPGLYQYAVRFRDQDNLWSQWYPGRFDVAPRMRLLAVEWVTDPDAVPGTGTPMEFSVNDDETFSASTADIDLFDYSMFPRGRRPTLLVRAQDNRNMHYDYTEIGPPPPDSDRGGWGRLSEPVVLDRCAVVTTQTPEGLVSLGANETVTFNLALEDPDGDPLPAVEWLVDGVADPTASGPTFSFTPGALGEYTVAARIGPGGTCETTRVWNVNAVVLDPSQPQIRPVLHVQITRPSASNSSEPVQYRYRWASDGNDPEITHGPKPELEDTVYEGQGVTFDLNERWTVTVTPVVEGRDGESVVGVFEVGRAGIQFVGWVLE